MEKLMEQIEEIEKSIFKISSDVGMSKAMLESIRKYLVVNNLINLVNIGLLKKEDLENYQDFEDFMWMLENFKK